MFKVIRSATVFATVFLSFSVAAQNPDVAKSDAIAKEWDGQHLESAKLYESAALNYEKDGVIDTTCFFKAGQNYLRAEQYAHAIPMLNRAIDLEWHEIRAWFYIADALLETGQYEEAQKKLTQAIDVHPGEKTGIYNKKARIALNTEKYDDAAAFADEGLSADAENSDLLRTKATALEESGDLKASIDVYEKMHELNPEDSQLVLKLGVLNFTHTNNKYTAERERYENMANPSRVDYSNLRKKLNQIAQEYKEAVKYLEKAHEANPDHKGVMQRLMVSYRRMGNEAKDAEFKQKLGM